jgi:hypothetical protein
LSVGFCPVDATAYRVIRERGIANNFSDETETVG